MRAVAVLLVVASHVGVPGLAGGFVGVDVFFVISGFLITGLLARDVWLTGRVSITQFYARRARRILPAATVTLLAIVAGSVTVYTAGNLDLVLADVKWAALFAENIHLAAAGTDYFTASSFLSPVQHFWSLAVEEQFYLVWPALIALATYLPQRAGATGQTRALFSLRRAEAMIAFLSLVSFAWSVYATAAHPQMAYFSTFTRVWELGIGALLALSTARVARLPAAVKFLATWAGLGAIVLAGVTFTEQSPFPGVRALLPVLGAALVLAGGTAGPRFGAGLLLGLRPMRFIGDISYSMYLWHWPLLILVPAYLDRPLRVGENAGLVVVLVGISWLSYRVVETPFRTSRGLSRNPRRAILLWPVALATVLGVTLAAYPGSVGSTLTPSTTAGPASLAQHASTSTADGRGAPALVASVTPQTLRQDVLAAAALARTGAPLPSNLQPNLRALWLDVSRPPPGCSAAKVPETSHRLCALGDTTSSRTIVVWGDSHASQWLAPLEELAKVNGFKVVPITKTGCLPIAQLVDYLGVANSKCYRFRLWAMKQILRLHPEHVIVSALVTKVVMDVHTGKHVPEAVGTAMFALAAQRTLAELRTTGATVTVIGDNTYLKRTAGDCLGSKRSDMSSCVAPMKPLIVQRNRAWQRAVAATGSRYVDLSPWFCDRDVCPMVIGNIIVYRDDNHITTTYARHLTPVLAAKLGFA
ncbi:MAG: hypothetical protein QOH80_58 [Actinomycetota bacterium]|nr:hypothetical protein [Actinomycetota bacterium]